MCTPAINDGCTRSIRDLKITWQLCAHFIRTENRGNLGVRADRIDDARIFNQIVSKCQPCMDSTRWVGWGLIWSQALDSDIVPESQSIENISQVHAYARAKKKVNFGSQISKAAIAPFIFQCLQLWADPLRITGFRVSFQNASYCH